MAAEAKRGCGYRKIGGLYLCGDGPSVPCDRLPFPLDICPTCKHGIKQTRGWTWIDAPELLGHLHEPCKDGGIAFPYCAICNPDHFLKEEHSAGLLWIGTQFYATPDDFLKEARELGVSRRIPAVPRHFKVGKTWVLFAHPKAILGPMQFDENNLPQEPEYTPGIFQAFRPNRIEKCLADDASDEEVKAWADKGFTVVKLPAGDKDHTGTVYDKDEAEAAYA